MEFDQLMTDILVFVSCKFEMYIFKLAQVICENIRIAFLYVLSIDLYHGKVENSMWHLLTLNRPLIK